MSPLSIARYSNNTLLHIALPVRQMLAVTAALLLSAFTTTALAQDYRLSVVAEDLHWPWSVQILPEGGFLVTERSGQLLHLSADGERKVLTPTPETLFAGQGGYFDVVLHPAFDNNRVIFLSYAEGVNNANHLAVYRAKFDDGKLSEGEVILRAKPDKSTPQHYGGRMLFLDDNSLLITSGEGFEHREEAQNSASELGKVLRVSDSGEAIGTGTGTSRIYSLGHRNPQGLVQIPSTGDIYLHEHGARGGDEINRLEPGINYGWPAVTHGVDYSGAYISPFKEAPGYAPPLWTWTPSIAPSGMAWYNGTKFPKWQRSLLVGALVDKEVRRIALRGGEPAFEEALFSELGERIRDVRVFGDSIYLLTDSESGKLIEVLPR